MAKRRRTRKVTKSQKLGLEALEARRLLAYGSDSVRVCGTDAERILGELDPSKCMADESETDPQYTILSQQELQDLQYPLANIGPRAGAVSKPVSVPLTLNKADFKTAKSRVVSDRVGGDVPTGWTYTDITTVDNGEVFYVSEVIGNRGESTGRVDYTVEVEFVYEDSGGNEVVAPETVEIEDFLIQENYADSHFGKGVWLIDFEYLVEESGGVSYPLPEGGAAWFEDLGNGAYSEPDGVFKTLSKSGNVFTMEDNYGNTSSFSLPVGSSGDRYLIDTKTDANNNETSFGYDDIDGDTIEDELVSVTDVGLGRSTTLSYYQSGQNEDLLQSMTDYLGRKTSFEYDSTGRLLDVFKPRVLKEDGSTVEPNLHYGWGSNGELASIRNHNGNTEYYTYEAAGGSITSHTDFEGHTHYYSPLYGRALSKIGGSGPSGNSIGDPLQPITPADYHAIDVNRRGYETTYTASEFGQLEVITDALGHVTEYQRDSDGRLESTSRFIQTGPDPSNVTQSVMTYAWSGSNLEHIYDADHVDPGALSEVAMQYNSSGLPTQIVDQLGRTTINEYDNLNNGINLEKSTTVMGTCLDTLGSCSESDDLVYEYQYTTGIGTNVLPKGLLRFETDPLGRVTEYQYHDDHLDPKTFGEIKKIILPQVGSTVAEIEYDYAFNYDTGNVFESTVVTVTDELGRETEYEYDGLDRLTRISAPDPDATTNPAVLTETFYKYDASGNLKEKVDAEGNSTLFDYDKMDRLIRVEQADPDGSGGPESAPVTIYTYDELGNLKTSVDPLGRMTSYQYDAANRLIAMIEPDVDGTVDEPHRNPANKYDVNSDGAVDNLDREALETAVGLETITDSEIPTFYLDIDGNDTFVASSDPGVNLDLADWIANSGAGAGPDYTNVDGRPVTLYGYDPSDNLTFVTDANGHTTKYEYDVRGRLVKMTQPQVKDENNFDIDPVTQYAYDKANQLISETDPLGRVSELVYDQAGRLTHSLGADVDGTIWPLQNKLNPFDVDENGFVNDTDADAVTQGPPGTLGDVNGDGVADALDVQAVDDFKDYGIIDPAVLDARPVERFVYDKVGNQTMYVDPMFNVTEYQYDERNRLIARISERPDSAKSSLDPTLYPRDATTARTNHPVMEYDYDAANRLTGATDEVGGLTEYVYDNLDRVEQLKLPDADGNLVDDSDRPVWTYTYDLMGNMTTSHNPINPVSEVTTYHLDDLYRVTKITEPEVVDGTNMGSGPDQYGKPETVFNFDAAGQLESVSNPLGYVTSYFYDGLGRLKTEVLPDPDTGLFDSNYAQSSAKSPYTIYSYDLVGNLKTKQDAEGAHASTPYQQEWDYDDLNRLKIARDELGKETTFAHDAVGNIITLTDPEANTTTWAYDKLNRPTSNENELTFSKSYGYDLNGNLISLTDRNDRLTTFEYDNLNRGTHERWYDGDATTDPLLRTFTFDFDLRGRMTGGADGVDFDYDYTFDALDRMDTANLGITGLTPQIDFDYGYDLAGNRTDIDATIGGVADFSNTIGFDAMNRMFSVLQTDNGGNNVADKYVEIDYDLASQFEAVLRAEGTSLAGTIVTATYFDFDKAGRHNTIEHFRGTSTVIINGYDLDYDRANRLTEFEMLSSLFDGESVTYEYNERAELETVDSVDPILDESYQYDDNGNRIDNDGTTNVIGGNNRLTDDGTFTYQYDDQGNRTVRTEKVGVGTASTEYEWDHRNRLTKVEEYSSPGVLVRTVNYTYDMYNQLLSRSVDEGGSVTDRFFVHDDAQIVLQFEGASASDLSHRYIWGPQIDQQLADEQVSDLASDGRVIWGVGGSSRDST